jgi:hypothetical protein
MRYEDVTIEVSDSATRTEEERRIGTCKVRVLQSPAGEMKPDEAVAVDYDDKDLQRALEKLDRRDLDRDGLVAVGRALAKVLLPLERRGDAPGVRELFALSLSKVGPDNGLRLRLRLPGDLSVIPWEYAYVERAGGAGMDGFLALDPRIAIVRHEVLAAPVTRPLLLGDIKVVTAVASPEGLPGLGLDKEMQFLVEALGGLKGIQLTPCEGATLKKLQPLLDGAGVFHFAGHGDFKREMGARPGTYTGTGFLALEDERVEAEQMGINLRGKGVRLAVLAGCHTGRRDGVSVWSGIAPALVKAEIPAVVANQYTIQDRCAIAFSRQFYQALAGGLPIERAVAAGRIAAYNEDTAGRDWGVPVLYLRAGDGQLFQGASDPAVRQSSKQAAEADVNVRVSQVKAGGVLVGAEADRMLEGKLAVAVRVAGTVHGEVTGGSLGSIQGGTVHSQVDVNEVGAGGRVTGLKVGTIGIGGSTRSARPVLGKKAAPPQAAPPAGAAVPGEKPAATPAAASHVGVGSMTGGQAIGTQVNTRAGDTVHGNQVRVGAGGEATLNTGIGGENVQIGSVTIYQGTKPGPGSVAAPQPGEHAIEEKLRLDVALPKKAIVDEPFDVVIAVNQPDAPVLSVADLDQVATAPGRVFRNEEDAVVKYRIELTGAGIQVSPPSYILKLRPREGSPPITFQVVSSKTGKRTLLVNAYQEDGVLAAQTRLSIEVAVAVAPK